MQFTQPVTEVIKQRYSCRSYDERPIDEAVQGALADFMAKDRDGPFGSHVRLELAAASAQDRQALKGLGTYGFIKGATGFLIGATRAGDKDLEDFGYLMERAILYATDLGLGTCWLGGSFTKSRFARKIGAQDGESVPAVVSTGYEAKKPRRMDTWIRGGAGSDHRLTWERLFFADRFDQPLSREAAGPYAMALEMVRLAPSASNKQPWRVVQEGEALHFYMQRSRGYGRGMSARLMRLADMQRIDMGIAMSHFDLAAAELELPGCWQVHDPGLEVPDELTEYVVSWQVNGQ